MESDFMSGKNAGKILGVHTRTLYNWERSGKIKAIRTPGGQRMYNIREFLGQHGDYLKNVPEEQTKSNRIKVCYCRVSSSGQKDDLLRQINTMREKYPTHKIISDIGSGINMNRLGLKKIVHLAIQGNLEELVVLYKDRLARFGYELLEHLILTYSKGKIIVENAKEDTTPESEIVDDVLQIMNVYVAKINGNRRWKNSKI